MASSLTPISRELRQLSNAGDAAFVFDDDYGQPISIYDQMKHAYNMACRLDPSISSASGTDRGQVKRAAAAQRSGVVAKSPAGHSDTPDKGLGESIEDLYDKLARTG